VPVVDRIRSMYGTFGVHVYRVFMVHCRWTGGRRGVGDPVIVSRREITPVPRVRDLGSVRRNLITSGVAEEGDVVVDRISARYTEDDLLGHTPDMVDPEAPRTSDRAMEFWYEVVENRPSNPTPKVRRFSKPVTVPYLKRDGLQWVMTLTKQDGDPGRRGERPDRHVE